MTQTTRDLVGILKDCKAGDPASALVLLDWLRDAGHDRLATFLDHMSRDYWFGGRGKAQFPDAAARHVETHFKALALFAALDRVDVAGVPVMSDDRRIDRKEQARLARQLFKRLGLKGISCTTPNYSMASSVDVEFPGRRDHDIAPIYRMPADAACQANADAMRQIEAILAAAFPSHDDRSDSLTDYFDCCWSVNSK